MRSLGNSKSLHKKYEKEYLKNLKDSTGNLKVYWKHKNLLKKASKNYRNSKIRKDFWKKQKSIKNWYKRYAARLKFYHDFYMNYYKEYWDHRTMIYDK